MLIVKCMYVLFKYRQQTDCDFCSVELVSQRPALLISRMQLLMFMLHPLSFKCEFASFFFSLVHIHLDLGVKEQFADFVTSTLILHCLKFLMFQLIIPLIHISLTSSDFVYLGNGPFSETDAFLQQLTLYIFIYFK